VFDKFGKTALIEICDVFLIICVKQYIYTYLFMNNTFIWFEFLRNVVD